jgi:L-cystine transport system substrate-binding protein
MRALRKRHTYTLVAAAIVVATMVLAGCGSSAGSSQNQLTSVKKAGVLRVALTATNPPWSYKDSSNQVVGFDADVAKAIAKRIGVKKVTFTQDTFQNFIPALRENKYDIVISGQTITTERAKQVAFTRPYQVNPVAIFVERSNTTITGKADLAGKRIAVSAGSTQEQLARTIPGAKVLTYENATFALTDLGRGRADAYLGSKFVGAYLAQKNHLAVKPTPGSLSSEVNAMTVKTGQTKLLQAVNKALGDMIDDGTFSTISKRWLGGLDMVPELRKVPTDPSKVASS